MKKIYQVCLSLISIPGLVYCIKLPYEAVVVVPIADLLGQSMVTMHTNNIIKEYSLLPICGKGNPFSCPRVHQLLFHERVTVTAETNTEVCIRVPHIFFTTTNNNEQNTLFWTLKRNIVPVQNIIPSASINKIPPPIQFDKQIDSKTIPTLTLAMPYKETRTGLIFSAGTRFVIAGQRIPLNTHMIPVYLVDPRSYAIIQSSIPRSISILNTKKRSAQEKQELFVHVLKKWAEHHAHGGFIPYVWGGCSFTSLCTKNSFDTVEKGNKSMYVRSDTPKPYAGLDCAGLIVRAAQIAQLPFYFKNTNTIAQYLAPLKPNENAQVGDIIWFPGHVMVVSDTIHNALIEARHYSHGYGKVHEIAIDKVFNGIHSIKQLQDIYLRQEPLHRLNSKGTVAQTIPHFKILRLHSIWHL